MRTVFLFFVLIIIILHNPFFTASEYAVDTTIQILLYNIIAHCISKGQLALRVRLPSSMMPHTVLLSYWPPFLSSWVQYSDCNRIGCSFRELTGEIFSHLWRAHCFFSDLNYRNKTRKEVTCKQTAETMCEMVPLLFIIWQSPGHYHLNHVNHQFPG